MVDDVKEIKLRDFLKVGTIIRTKHCESPNWVSNIVYGLSEDALEIDMGLEKEYIKNLIMVGDVMHCRYTDDLAEYIVIGWVSKINVGLPESLTVRVHKINKFENKRESYRYDVYLGMGVSLAESNSKPIFAILTNISMKGMAFVVKDDLGKLFECDEEKVLNSNLLFQINVSVDKTISLTGKIVRRNEIKKRIEYGVKILNVNSENEKFLEEFLNELEEKDNELYNKRCSYWSKNSNLK